MSTLNGGSSPYVPNDNVCALLESSTLYVILPMQTQSFALGRGLVLTQPLALFCHSDGKAETFKSARWAQSSTFLGADDMSRANSAGMWSRRNVFGYTGESKSMPRLSAPRGLEEAHQHSPFSLHFVKAFAGACTALHGPGTKFKSSSRRRDQKLRPREFVGVVYTVFMVAPRLGEKKIEFMRR